MRSLCLLLVGALALPAPTVVFAQEPAHRLNLVIVEGEGPINNIRQRTSRELVVQVDDENHRPVAGAAVLFALPRNGAGGAFTDGSHTVTAITDAQGRAVAHGFMPNSTKGQFQIQVSATYNGVTASAVMTETNAVVGPSGTVAAAGVSGKLIAILVIAAGAAAGGTYYAVHNSGGGNGATVPAGTSISPGSATVGPPH